MKIAYDHLIQYIEEKPSLEDISRSLFQLGHEHEIENKVFDMEFTPNRGDCLSVNGLLRDLGAFFTIKLNQNFYNHDLDELKIDFVNEQKNTCHHISFLKIEIEGDVSSYKGNLKSYFSDLKISSNNFFTDISNFISYETGQPTHCYDESKINGKITLSEIERSYEFDTLLGKKIVLNDKNLVFLNGNEVINLAGVIGSKSTSCSKATKSVIIECAYFKPEAIIGKALKYDIQSEAAHKFERGVDPECHEDVLRRFIAVVKDHAAIKNISFISYKYENLIQHDIPFNIEKVNNIIGIDITAKEYTNYLGKLGFTVVNNAIKVPSSRSDIKTQNDLAEEIARVIGYNNIPVREIRIPKSTSSTKFDKKIEAKVRSFLLDNGFYEVINSPFVSVESKESIKVDNPLDSNRKFLRTNLTNSLTDNLLFNERRQKDSIKLFEISDIYFINNGLQKKRRIAIIASGRVGKNYKDFSKKINESYLFSLFQKILPNKEFTFINLPRDKLNSKLKHQILSLEVDIHEFSSEVLSYDEISQAPKEFIQYQSISDLPSSYRDISYSVKDFAKVRDLQDLILGFKDPLLKEVFIFDYFHNEKSNEIKIGFRFIFQSANTTIIDKQVDDILNDVITASTAINSIDIPGLGS
tara:strand:+ start:4387 stop:6303 length:1917 start_codon:yes stop_codon:yes gene_type:complete